MNLKPKPAGLETHYAAQFKDAAVVAAYGTRPPYPEPLVSLALQLAGSLNRRILDLGCGTGELTRRLAPHVSSVTAIDHSEGMVALARRLPGGNAPNIEWIVGCVENVTLAGSFSLSRLCPVRPRG